METNAKDILESIQSGELSTERLEELLARVKKIITDEPSKGKEYGHLMSVITNAIRQKDEKADINWVGVGNGELAIGHKPGGKISFDGMKNEGVTHVLTLLQGNEGALQIGDKVKKSGMDWIWFPFSASHDNLLADTTKVSDLFRVLKEKLDVGAKIYVHCSAGIHRTGMIAYGLLRFMEFEKNDAMMLLRKLREVTADQVGEERILWGDRFAGC